MRYSSLFFTFLLIYSSAFAQKRFDQALEAFLQHPDAQYASVGLSVQDVNSGEVLAAFRKDQSLVPASNLKLLTTATALALLGSEYTFKTELRYDGFIDEQGILLGNLYIKGFGDPVLGSDQMPEADDLSATMNKFVSAVQRAGITKITGKIVGDDSYFTDAPNCPSWQWNDIGNYYGAGAFGLNIHENLYYLHFQQQSKLGATPPIASIQPEVSNLLFTNEVASAASGSGDNAYIYGSPLSGRRVVRGTIPVGSKLFRIKGSIPDPALFAAEHLQRALLAANISVEDGVCSRSTCAPIVDGKIIYTHPSPPLRVIVDRANKKSVNLYCEVLLKHIGQAASGQATRAAGIEAVRAFWQDRGLNVDGLFMEDGSGLSSKNAITPAQMTGMLRKIALDKNLYPDFNQSLPVAGTSGSLEYRFKNSVVKGNLRAKTGSLERVRSFSGYLRSRSGKELAFSFIINHFGGSGGAMREAMEQVMGAMYEL